MENSHRSRRVLGRQLLGRRDVQSKIEFILRVGLLSNLRSPKEIRNWPAGGRRQVRGIFRLRSRVNTTIERGLPPAKTSENSSMPALLGIADGLPRY